MTDIQSLIQEYKMTGNKEIYHRILNIISSLDTIWSPISQHTRSCYVEIKDNIPTAYIFTRQDYCEEFRERLSNAMLLVRTVANPVNLRLQMFSDFLRSGIQRIIIDSGHVYQEILISDMIKENDPPSGQVRKPVKNPEVVVCANILVQEMSRRNAPPVLRENLIKAVTRGEFLVPANKNVKYDETGKIEIGSQISFQMIRNPQGHNFIPVYTDLIEFKKFDTEDKFAGIIVPFAGIKPLLEKAEGIVINPQGANVPLNMKINEKKPDVKNTLDKQVSEGLINDSQEESRYDSNYTLGSSEALPEEMLKEVSEFLSTQKGVRKAYAIGITRANKPGCLYIVEFEGDSIALYQGLVMTSARYVGALQVEMREYNLPEAKRAIEGKLPFYEA